ncbi:MAG TPA: DUF1236 domain-containing protein [Terriglobales bacterium]|nr:DUF1236 domain-containing protein [Terriglobales bacterium]
MKKKLLATVAVAAVVGFGGVAAAQSQMGDSNKSPSATQEKSGGSMSGTQSGNKTLNPSSTQSSKPSSGQSAQGTEKSGKDNERLGQGREDQKGMTRGAQEEKGGMQQKGAREERGEQKNLKGAQEERGQQKNLKGAREERGERGNLQGAQEQRGTTERGTAETNRSGVNTSTSVENRGTRGGSVQLSEDQRSQIKTIIGRERGPRLGSNANFSVSVGTRVPRSVHVAVLPSDIVRIVPEYRGYDYFLVGDEIVIVDPRTLEIVAIIPA